MTTHYFGDDCFPPHQNEQEVGKEEFFQKLHEVETDTTGAHMALLIQKANDAFDEWCQRRHTEGGQKYGPVKFLEVNSMEEAMAEVVDLANYARYTFIRLYLLNAWADEAVGAETVFGQNKFVSNKEKG